MDWIKRLEEEKEMEKSEKSEKSEKKVCPIMILGAVISKSINVYYNGNTACGKHKCAWWIGNKDRGCCAITEIAKQVKPSAYL